MKKQPDVPLEILERAKKTWNAAFSKDGINYTIGSVGTNVHYVVAKIDEKIIWIITGPWENSNPALEHDALKVEAEHRGKWVGEMLFYIKTTLDGKRWYEWSGKYSRIRFLIKQWYYPIKKADSIEWQKIRLSGKERKILCQKIRQAKEVSYIDDDTDDYYYLKLAPYRAHWLMREL